MAPAHAGGIDERDGAAQLKTERTGKWASFAEVTREPRDDAAAGSYARIQFDQVESNAPSDRVDCLPDGLELGNLSQ
jgi:hypothetical protein